MAASVQFRFPAQAFIVENLEQHPMITSSPIRQLQRKDQIIDRIAQVFDGLTVPSRGVQNTLAQILKNNGIKGDAMYCILPSLESAVHACAIRIPDSSEQLESPLRIPISFALKQPTIDLQVNLSGGSPPVALIERSEEIRKQDNSQSSATPAAGVVPEKLSLFRRFVNWLKSLFSYLVDLVCSLFSKDKKQ